MQRNKPIPSRTLIIISVAIIGLSHRFVAHATSPPPHHGLIRGTIPKHDDDEQPTKDEIKVSVSVLDTHGEQARVGGIHPPRYLIGKLGVINPNHNNNDTNDNSNNDVWIEAVQYFTFDLGNHKEAILHVDGCRGCKCEECDEDGNFVGCCPDRIPSSCLTQNSDDDGDEDGSCHSSHYESDQSLPIHSYEVDLNNDRDDDGNCILSPLPDDVFPQDHEHSHFSSSNEMTRVCHQCSGASSHSRFFTMAKSDRLVLLDPNHNNNNANNNNQYLLGKGFRFAALIRTLPSINRTWSNFGLGYQSSFLKQLDLHSMYLHLRAIPISSGFDKSDDNNEDEDEDDRSMIVFNPSPERYLSNSMVAPYEISHRHVRVHSVSNIRVGNVINDSTTNDDVMFHMDTGNDGISLVDETLIANLQQATNGEWANHDDTDNKSKSDPFLFDWLEDDEEEDDKSKIMENQCSQKSRYNNLYVPYSPIDAPILQIVLSPGIVISIPGNVWVLPGPTTTTSSSSVDSDSENSGDDGGIGKERYYYKSVFSTYHKNVLGLPFLCAADFMFDDDALNLYVVGAATVAEGEDDSQEERLFVTTTTE